MNPSTVYCLIPVHNRKEITRRCLQYLNAQDYPAIHTVIVDDGSTDGTGQFLAERSGPNLSVLTGDGNLWWSGAMRMGMEFVSKIARDSDYLLMLNDDVHIEATFVSTLVRDSLAHGSAVVGAAQYDESNGGSLGFGYRIDFWKMRFIALTSFSDGGQVDALPGRGVLFPYSAIRDAGHVYAKLFPHCMSDLEYSFRVREKGWKVAVSRDARVFTSPESPTDKKIRAKGWFITRFSLRSKNSLVLRLLFFTLHGPWLLRLFALPRYLVVGGWRWMRRR